MQRGFQQLDVFSTSTGDGNPLAVIVDGEGLTDAEMAQFANWTNLSETTFLLPPSSEAADYRVRIFTVDGELPFAGHPTLGSCQAWLNAGGAPRDPDVVVQECAAGLIRIRRRPRLAFGAPPLTRSGPVDAALHALIQDAVRSEIIATTWCDNGPGWVGALLPDGDAVLAARPNFAIASDLKLGLVGPYDADVAAETGVDFEVRAFYPGNGATFEDPVTGSLNAAVAQWLMRRDPTLRSYVAAQGAALGRRGRVYVERSDDATIWVGGDVVTAIDTTIDL